MSTGPKQTLQQGYEKFVIKNPEGCWSWKGCAPKNPGYGQFRYSMKRERAHRASWLIHKGEIPKGLNVLHKCDNRLCSNPDHLFLGTTLDNNRDMIKKGRSPIIASGEKNPNARLNATKVKMIRNSNLKNIELSRLLKVGPMTISRVRRNKLWKEVS